jgi:hypothetical protein
MAVLAAIKRKEELIVTKIIASVKIRNAMAAAFWTNWLKSIIIWIRYMVSPMY